MTSPELLDQRDRPLRNLRLSVTDRCNLRCSYCMPEEVYTWLPRESVLHYEELAVLAEAFVGLGVEKVRLTGGEPLLRRDLDRLVAMLVAIPGLREVTLTTNGIHLGRHAASLREAGLSRVTVSLDTLNVDTYRTLTRRDDLGRVLDSVATAQRVGFPGTKMNTVVMRGVNDGELEPLIDFATGHGIEPRFIEYMDVGGATSWSANTVVTRAEILERLESALGPITPEPSERSAPADRFRLADGRVFGVIASTSTPFCGDCDRSRVTADGHWFTCLYAREGFDLRGPLRAGATAEGLREIISGRWRLRADRGAEDRLAEARRGSLADSKELRANPHLEMHTRGG